MDISINDRIKNIKCILFDLDGTLMHAHPTFISQYSADVLNKLQDNGYYVGFSTGRALTSLGFLLRPVGLKTNMPSIGCAGAEIGIAGALPGNAIYKRLFPGDTLIEMLSLALHLGLNFSLDAHGTLYTSENLEYAATYMTNYRLAEQYGVFFPKPTPINLDNITQVNDGTVLKPMLWYDTIEQFHLMDPWFKTIVAYTTEALMEEGLENKKGIQKVGNITIYPHEYFAPINVITGRLHITPHTRSIHRYMGSWDDENGNVNGNGNENKNENIKISLGYLKKRLRNALPEWVFYLNNKIKRRKYRI